MPLRASAVAVAIALASCASLPAIAAGSVAPVAPDATLPSGLRPVDLPDARLAALGITLVAPEPASLAMRTVPAIVAARPGDALILAAPVAGLVAAVLVEPNQRVRAGQTVAVLQAPALADEAAEYVAARAEAEVADDTLERERALQAEGVIAAARVRRAEATALQTHARRDARHARLRMLGLDDTAIERIDLRQPLPTRIPLASPGDGIVVEMPVAAGARVEANALVARFARPDRLVLELRMPAADVARIVPGTAVVDATGRRIATLGPTAGEVGDGQTLRVRARLDASVDWLPGRELEVRLASSVSGWRLPRSTVVRAGEGHAVFAREGGRLVPVPVRLLADDGDQVVVAGGLAPRRRVAAGNVAAVKGAAAGIGAEAP